jgi:hypothetical protein
MIECGAAAVERDIEQIKREIIARRFNTVLARTA